MPWYLYFALKQIFPTQGRISFFTAVALGGVTVGVMLLIIVLSLMNGFGEEVRARIVNTSGHIRVVKAGVIDDVGPLLARVRSLPEVAAAAPYASGMALLQSGEKMAFPHLQGIDPSAEGDVVPLGTFLVAGRLDDLDDDTILIGSGLAERLNVRVGDQVDLFSPASFRPLQPGTVRLPRSLRVAGVFRTNWSQLDENSTICTLRLLQDLAGLGHGVNGVTVRLKPDAEPDQVVAKLNQLLPPAVRAVSWQDTNRDFLYLLQLEKNVMFFLLFFIEVVAAFAIAGALLLVVTRRSREIGLLAALGARPREIAGIFCLQGLLIGSVGTILGVGCAWLALHYRHGLLEALAFVAQSKEALARFYEFSDIPAKTSAHDLALVVAASLVISALAGLLPARRAARLKPAVALRSE